MDNIGRRGWQLPYLRVELILKTLTTGAVDRKSRREIAPDIRNLEKLRNALAQAGWFN